MKYEIILREPIEVQHVTADGFDMSYQDTFLKFYTEKTEKAKDAYDGEDYEVIKRTNVLLVPANRVQLVRDIT